MAEYHIPDAEKRCSACRWCKMGYEDDFWCARTPKPEGLGRRRQVRLCGTCEYWEPRKTGS